MNHAEEMLKNIKAEDLAFMEITFKLQGKTPIDAAIMCMMYTGYLVTETLGKKDTPDEHRKLTCAFASILFESAKQSDLSKLLADQLKDNQ